MAENDVNFMRGSFAPKRHHSKLLRAKVESQSQGTGLSLRLNVETSDSLKFSGVTFYYILLAESHLMPTAFSAQCIPWLGMNKHQTSSTASAGPATGLEPFPPPSSLHLDILPFHSQSDFPIEK